MNNPGGLKWWNRLKTFWREQGRHRWHDIQWGVIGGLWLVTPVLGYLGFARLFAARQETRSPWDLFYLALQLFTLESGSLPGPKSWELEVARLLAPTVAAYTAVRALTVLFSEQFQSLRLRFIRDHVVICGLGRKGFLLAKGFLARGEQVVVIEQNEDDHLLGPCRDQGAMVLIGDATDPHLLHRAGVQAARYLVAAGGDDGVNAEIAVHARQLAAGREEPLTRFVHLVDPQLCDLLRERELEDSGAFRLEFFNVYGLGARALLEEYPPFDEAGPAPATPPHLLVVGLGRMGQSLVVRAARHWRERQGTADTRLRITIVDREAERKVQTLGLRYPQLAQVCELIPRQMDIRWPEYQRAEFLFDPQGCSDVTAIYICLGDDSAGLTAGLTLLQKLRGRAIPIVVRMSDEAGLATLLRRAEGEGGAFANLHAFGLLDRTCRPELLLGGTHEMLARAIHEEYVRHQAEQGQTPESNPSMVPWDELPEGLKESNRRQADHIGVKLRAVGCAIAPLTDWEAERFQFTAEEVERMAEMEHQRFVEERRRAGWTYAPGPKDLERRTSPDLVPWDELPASEKEKDRHTVRELPRLLARAGLQVYRLN
ncbi:MAG: NAD-binding protein [Anaerolineae bacterium]|nr:NAD-binding protein [Anaerolineae bacterium]